MKRISNEFDEYGRRISKRFDPNKYSKIVKPVELTDDEEYEKLKNYQTRFNCPLSVRREVLERCRVSNLINTFEYKFYSGVYSKFVLTYKQSELKKIINKKMLIN
jgi:hypothetical protein